MRHATQEDLDQLEALLAELRKLPRLRERRRGYFSRGGRAFLHFHEDAGDYYVDVKFDGKFQRMKVTSHSDQALSLTRVKEALRSNGRPAANPEVWDFPPGTGIAPRISEPQRAGERD